MLINNVVLQLELFSMAIRQEAGNIVFLDHIFPVEIFGKPPAAVLFWIVRWQARHARNISQVVSDYFRSWDSQTITNFPHLTTKLYYGQIVDWNSIWEGPYMWTDILSYLPSPGLNLESC